MTTWQGCYDDSWKGLITDESFAHPAKMARGLVSRIFDHAFAEGWLARGDVVADPFGGIGSTGIEAASRGCRAFLCELEPRFVALAETNFALHRRTWEACGDPLPVIVQGDSRRLCEVLGPVMASAVIGSPPFIDARQDTTASIKGKTAPTKHDPEAWTQADCVVSSPPYTSDVHLTELPNRFQSHRDPAGKAASECRHDQYGQTPGQLGAMKAGDVAAVIGVDAVISSPPYAESINAQSHGIDWSKAGPATGNRKREGSKCDETLRQQLAYGSTDGQLGAMKAGSVAAVISSPDYVNSDTQPTKLGTGKATRDDGDGAGRNKGDYLYSNADGKLGAMPPGSVAAACDLICSSPPYEGRGTGNAAEYTDEEKAKRDASRDIMRCKAGASADVRYGTTPGNVGNDTGETFWAAAREIVQQCFEILRPGGICCWVCKDFVRKSQRVPFSADWQHLCIACGFTPVEWIKASLVKEQRNAGLFGEDVVKTKSRKSFFRRLAEAKGSPAIDHEDVIIVQKPFQ